MGDSNLLRFIHYASNATKAKLALVLVSASLIITVTLLTLSFLWKVYKGPEHASVSHEMHRAPASLETEDVFTPHEIKGVVVGFMDKNDTRLAQAQFTLLFHCSDEPCRKNLILNHAKVLDTLFEVGSDFYIEDFQKSDANKGFARFKSKLTEQLNKKFAHLAPRGISINDWNMN